MQYFCMEGPPVHVKLQTRGTKDTCIEGSRPLLKSLCFKGQNIRPHPSLSETELSDVPVVLILANNWYTM